MIYKFQKYSGIASRHTCPNCGRKHCFTLYVDEDNRPIHETVGRCDHESSCGYHYTPKQFFRDHPELRPESSNRLAIKPTQQNKPDKVWWIPMKYVDKSVRFDIDSQFTAFLQTILDPFIVEGLIDEYRLGVTKSREVIFFQIDAQGRCRTGKIMMYDPATGHRIKDEDMPGRITWGHSRLKWRLPKSWTPTQCLFGEHLLAKHPDAKVALVESEKTAVIAAGILPKYIWLATGGKSQFNARLSVLKGRTIIAFPDVDGYDLWRRNAAEMPELQITVSDLLERVATPEDRKNHIDIADLLIREMLNPVPREPSLEEIVSGLPEEAKWLIEDLGLVAIRADVGEVKGQYSGKS